MFMSNESKVWAKQFGDKLKRLIHIRGLTQKQFAHEIRISEVMMSQYISGRSCPNAYIVLRMADVLNCDVNELYNVND